MYILSLFENIKIIILIVMGKIWSNLKLFLCMNIYKWFWEYNFVLVCRDWSNRKGRMI